MIPLVLLALLAACDNDCDFFEQCNGDIREVCGSGVDQITGRRIQQTPCEGLNSVCVELDAYSTMCAADPATACDRETFQPFCEGDLLTTCTTQGSTTPYEAPENGDPAYQVQTDCGASGLTCDDATGTCQ